MVAISTITTVLGIGLAIGASIINFYLAGVHPEQAIKNELNITGFLSLLGIVFTIIFPPLGILFLLAVVALNIHASTKETNQSYHNWLIAAAFMIMAGAILSTLSLYYIGLKKLTPGTQIPTVSMIAVLVGAVLVFISAIINFVIGGRHPNTTVRNELYASAGLSFAALLLTPVLALFSRPLATIGLVMVGAAAALNFYLAGHEDDIKVHDPMVVSAWMSIIGVVMFSLAVYYLGAVKAKPVLTGLREARTQLPEFIPAEQPAEVPAGLLARIPADVRSQIAREEIARQAQAQMPLLAGEAGNAPGGEHWFSLPQ